MKAGAHYYLTKPLDAGEFYRVISETKTRATAAPECALA
jgi:FixJ family two-component response regulator